MSQTYLTRRTVHRPATEAHDVSGILAAGITTGLRKARHGILTWWRTHPDGRTPLARATIITNAQCIVEVLTEDGLRSVRHRVHTSPDELLALTGPARALLPAGVVHHSALIDLDDTGYIIDDWLSDERLGDAWRIV